MIKKLKNNLKEYGKPILWCCAGVVITILLAHAIGLTLENKNLDTQNSTLNIANAKLEHERDSLHNIYDILENKNDLLDSTIVVKEDQLKKYKLELKELQSKLDSIDNNIVNIDSTVAYNKLMHRYIPEQDLRYKFASNQVISIYKDILRYDISKSMIVDYKNSLALSESKYNDKSKMYDNCVEQKILLSEEINKLDNKANNLEAIITNKDKQIKNNKWLTRVVSTALTATVVYILIGK
jgi:hypothetical protein